MLEHHPQHHDGFARMAIEQQAAGAHAKLGTALHEFGHHIHTGAAFAQLHIQAGSAVIAEVPGGVVTRKLKGMAPLELHHHLLRHRAVLARPHRACDAHSQPQQKNPNTHQDWRMGHSRFRQVREGKMGLSFHN